MRQKKTFVYLLSAAAEDEETQRRGFVFVVYHIFPMKFFSQFDHELFYNVPEVLDWLPIRITGCHFCYNNPLIRSVAAVAMLVCGPELRAIFRLHHGTCAEKYPNAAPHRNL
jgi:hypothetical protein